jgi:hypothetical protein
MPFRRMGTGAPGLALIAAVLAAGCATGANVGDLDAGGSSPEDATSREDGKTGPDGSVPFNDTGFPGVDATSKADAGHANDASEPDASADDAGSGDAGGDDAAHGDDAGMDSGNPGMDSSTMCPAGTTGPGCTQCASGFHLCGATCTANQTNDPSVGCSQSCGTGACPAMGGQAASCSAAGACTYACSGGQKLCGSTCAACCVDTDCPGSTPLCTGGTCQPCPLGYGSCATACDTSLTTNSNCGACGVTCAYNETICIATTLAGSPFECGCEDQGGSYVCD